MSATREGGFARSRARLVVCGAFALLIVGCRGAAPPVPALVARPFAAPEQVPRPIAAEPHVDESVKCIDPLKIVEVHACPDGPIEDYGSLVAAETARLATTTKHDSKARQRSKSQDLAPRPFTATETTYRERVERFVCRAPDGIERNEARYALARLHFEAHHWDEAATLFHENAQIPDDATAPYAVSLSLESLDVLGTRGKTDCYDLLAARSQAYFDSFCGSQRHAANETLCITLGQILRDLRRITSG